MVCSPVGINQEIIQPGVNGFCAKNHGEWLDCLTTLIQNSDLRREMGLRGVETVQKGYSLEVNFHKILQILHSLT